MNLLLIDDNALVRASLAGLLCDLFPGLTVVEAASCEAARRITDVHFTHVLVDFHLSPVAQAGFVVCEPGQEVLEGWECLEVLSYVFPQARLVLMSAQPRAEMLAPALAAGASDFVEKSVFPGTMLADLKRAIHG